MTLKGLIQLSDIGMVQFLHNFHLPLDTLPSIGFHQFDFLVDFDCYLLVEHLVETQPDDGVGTLTDTFANEIVV